MPVIICTPFRQPGLNSPYALAITTDSPLGYWRLGDPSGTVATEEINNNHGTYIGTPQLGQTALIDDPNTSVTFDGINDYVNLNVITSEFPTNTVTSIEFWFNTTTLPPQPHHEIMFSIHDTVGDNILRIGIGTSGAIHIVYALDGSFNYGSGFHDGENHHLVFVDENTGTFKAYIDGIRIANTTQPSAPISWVNATQVTLAQEWDAATPTDHFTGTLDEVAMYNYALTSTQILDHYQVGSNASDYEMVVRADAAKAFWKFDETSGTVAVDSIRNRNGVYQNTPTLTTPSLVASEPLGTAVSINAAQSESVTFTSAAAVTSGSNFSIELFFSRPVDGITTRMYCENGATSVTAIFFVTSTNALKFQVWNTNTWYPFETAADEIVAGVTYHVVVTKNSSTGKKLYINGVEKGTSTNTISNSLISLPSTVGGYYSGGVITAYTDVTVDNLSVYTSTLTPTQVLNHYNIGQ